MTPADLRARLEALDAAAADWEAFRDEIRMAATPRSYDVTMSRTEARELLAHIEALQEALLPFSVYAGMVDCEYVGSYRVPDKRRLTVAPFPDECPTLGDCRRARAALHAAMEADHA